MSFLNLLTSFPSGKQYTITAGSRTPTLGNSSTTWTPSGWTSLQNANRDDGFVTVPFPFNFYFNDIVRTEAHIGSNRYITFGAGSGVFSGLSSTNPALDKIFLRADDNSFQRVAYQHAADSTYARARVEGASAPSGTPGSSTVIYEITFFNPANTGYRPTIEILVGNSDAAGGINGMYTAAGVSLGAGAAFNQFASYVLRQAGGLTGSFETTSGYIGNSGY